MFSSLKRDVAWDRAAYLRDLEYIRENVQDAPIMESFLQYDSCGSGLRLESDIIPPDEQEEITQAIEELPETMPDTNDEVSRIVETPSASIGLDEVMGLESAEPDLEAEFADFMEN